MQDLNARLKIIPKIVVASALFAVGCSSSTPPPSPPASVATTTSPEGEESSDRTLSKSEELNKSNKDEDDEDEEDEEEDGEDDKDKQDEDEESEFNFGGAKFGEKEVVKKCVDAGKFFDRFDAEEVAGKCTKLLLAKVNCDAKGLKKVLSKKHLEQFNKAISDDSSAGYKGWTIDQCLDCNNELDEDLCKSSSGKEQVGTKVFFLKEADSELMGKSMVLPVRPGQSKD